MTLHVYRPHSTAIETIEYDDEAQVAMITFTNGKQVNHDVTPEEMAEWMATPSVGRYYALNIKGR